MKKIATLLFLFIGFISMAQSNLTVFNNNGQQFYVILNGIKQNSIPQTNVYISGIRNGSYSLKLIFADGKTGDIDKMFFIDTPSDITTRVIFKKGKGKLQWIGQVPTNGVMQQQGVIVYRPDNSAIYSDAPVTTTQQVVTQTTTTTTNPVMTNQSGATNGNVTINSGMNGGTTTTQSGTVGGTVNTTNSGVTQTTTVTDPSNPSGNFGMNININVTDPTLNNGNGGVNIGMNGTGIGTQTNTTTTQGGNVNVNSTTYNNGYETQTTTPGGNVNVNMNGVQTSSSTTTTTQTTTTTTTSGGTTTYNNGNNIVTNGTTQVNSGMNNGNSVYTNTVNSASSTISCTKVLGDADVYIADLKTITFDEDRKETILKDMMNKCLNASQAYKILETLTFENDRLELAKYLYDRLLDKDKGSTLLPLFKFEASKMEFRDYMRK